MKRLLLFLIMLAAMITYFPQGVRAADGYYSVTFVAEGGTVVVGETRCGTPYTMEVSQGGGIYKRITAESFDTDGKARVFAGWSYEPDGNVELTENTIYGYYPSKDITFYAVWTEAVRVTYDAVEGYFLDNSSGEEVKVRQLTIKVKKGDTLPGATVHNDDRHRMILGLSYTKGGSLDIPQKDIWATTVDKDITLYCVWADAYVVTYNANGGYYTVNGEKSECSERQYQKGYGISMYYQPHHENRYMVFKGWSLTPGGDVIDVFALRPDGDITFYAVWSDETPGNVIRISGSDRYHTSMKAALEYRKETGIIPNYVILASGTNYADALSGSYISYTEGAPILLVPNDPDSEELYEEIRSFILGELDSHETIYILGGTAAVPEEVLGRLKDMFEIKRLSGPTRYETNLEILKEMNVRNSPILVATGKNFADSLSASATGLPVLLVDEELTESQKEFLTEMQSPQYYVLGGTGAVSETVEEQLKEYGEVKRIAGRDRHETSVKIAEEFCNDAENAVLACSSNFPDGLCGGLLARMVNGPVILTATDSKEEAAKFCRSRNISKGYVLGGSRLISDEAAKSIFSYGGEITVK